jgi:formiminoglutamase
MPTDLSDLLLRPDPRDPRAPGLLRAPGSDGVGPGSLRLLGLPYDGGIPSRPGARFGPGAIRAALASFGSFDGQQELASIADHGDLSLPGMNAAEAHRRIAEAARRIFSEEGGTPLFLGGDHGCTGSLIRGFAAARPEARLALVTLDAHLDVREYEDEASLSSGTPFRRALETEVLDGSRVAMVGIRRFANSRHYLDWAREREIRLLSPEEVGRDGATAVMEEVLAGVMRDADALYLSIDIDAVDAAFAPGASAAGPGGLTAREAIGLVTSAAGHEALVGADIMEVSPPYDQDGRTAKLAARLLLEIAAARGG